MVSSVSPVTGWFLVRVTFTKQYWFFEVFLSVLRVLTQFLLIFEVFELKFNVEISFWGISYSRLLILSHFLLSTLDFEPFLTVFTYFEPFLTLDFFAIWLKTTGDTGDNWWQSEVYIYRGWIWASVERHRFLRVFQLVTQLVTTGDTPKILKN